MYLPDKALGSDERFSLRFRGQTKIVLKSNRFILHKAEIKNRVLKKSPDSKAKASDGIINVVTKMKIRYENLSRSFTFSYFRSFLA